MADKKDNDQNLKADAGSEQEEKQEEPQKVSMFDRLVEILERETKKVGNCHIFLSLADGKALLDELRALKGGKGNG